MISPFYWFGVVEDVNDPLKLGRLRVRVVGSHNDNHSVLPTSSLLWAIPVQPIQSAAMAGVGWSPTGPLVGTRVFGLFLDGLDGQQPLVLGTIAGINSNESTINQNGFQTKDVVEALVGWKDEPDTSRLARNESTDETYVVDQIDNIIQMIDIANSDEMWEEPTTSYAAVYPFNHVYSTQSGHVLEFDDTPGHERIHLRHKSGSYLELRPNGSVVFRTEGSNTQIIIGDNRVYVDGDCIMTVEGSMKILSDDLEIETKGDVNHQVAGSYTVKSKGPMKFTGSKIDLN